jgi:hypothetical protein
MALVPVDNQDREPDEERLDREDWYEYRKPDRA